MEKINNAMEELNQDTLVEQLRQVGVKQGDLLHLKVSMKAIGKINGGASTLLNALLEVVGSEGTLVADAFVDVYPLPLTEDQKSNVVDDNSPSYAGVFTNEMIKHPQMIRSKHPIQKFVAIGKLAEELCFNHTYESGGYYLLEKMSDKNAKNLTIGEKVAGVGTTHIAIEKAGFVRKQLNKGVLYRTDSNKVKLAVVNWNGGCAAGFPKFIPYYEKYGAIISKSKIGNAEALLTDMKITLEIEQEILKKDPHFFLCDDKACYSCRMTWDHSKKNKIKFYLAWIKKNYKSLGIKRITRLLKTIRPVR